MKCPDCKIELEIFAKGNEEIYVCPQCLAALVPDESSFIALKHFCTQEIIRQLLEHILDDSLFENTKEMLKPHGEFACPNCKSYMRKYDFDKKIRFFVKQCISCRATWMNSMQLPLVAIAFLKNNPDDANFKNTILDLYDALAKKRKVRMSLDDLIAPYIVFTGLLPAIPRGDNIATNTYPHSTRGIVIACVAIFVLDLMIKLTPLFALIANKAVGEFQLYRFITYSFLHANIFHLSGNMFFLWTFGRSVEDALGWRKYSLLYVIGALFSALLFVATMTNKDISCVGASGAISAIMGAHLILFPKAKLRFDIVHPITFQKIKTTHAYSLYYILFWIIMNVIFGALQSVGKTAGVAYWGHIGGLIAGIIFIEIYKSFRQR